MLILTVRYQISQIFQGNRGRFALRESSQNSATESGGRPKEKAPVERPGAFLGVENSGAENYSDGKSILSNEIGCGYFLAVLMLSLHDLNPAALGSDEKTPRAHL